MQARPPRARQSGWPFQSGAQTAQVGYGEYLLATINVSLIAYRPVEMDLPIRTLLRRHSTRDEKDEKNAHRGLEAAGCT